jgi:hypothetical protein
MQNMLLPSRNLNLFKNEYRIFKPVEITIRRGLR